MYAQSREELPIGIQSYTPVPQQPPPSAPYEPYQAPYQTPYEPTASPSAPFQAPYQETNYQQPYQPPSQGKPLLSETTVDVGYVANDLDLPHRSTERNKFIARVLGIVTGQIFLAVLISTLFWFYVPLDSIPWWSLMIALILMFVFLFGCYAVREKTPLNYFALFLFTLVMGFVVAVCILPYSGPAILNALFSTLLVTFCLIGYVLITKEDLTFSALKVVVLCLWAIFWTAIFSFLFFPLFFGYWMSVYGTIFSFLGVVLYSALLLFDVCLVCNSDLYLLPGGEVIAAINLFLDIVNIFLCFLSLGRK